MGTSYSSTGQSIDLPIPDVLNSDTDDFDNYHRNYNVSSDSDNNTGSDSNNNRINKCNMAFGYIDTFVDRWYEDNKTLDTTRLNLPTEISAIVSEDIEKAIYKKNVYLIYSIVYTIFSDIKANIYKQFFRIGKPSMISNSKNRHTRSSYSSQSAHIHTHTTKKTMGTKDEEHIMKNIRNTVNDNSSVSDEDDFSMSPRASKQFMRTKINPRRSFSNNKLKPILKGKKHVEIYDKKNNDKKDNDKKDNKTI